MVDLMKELRDHDREHLSTRAYNCLSGFKRIEDITPDALRKIPNCGRRTVREIAYWAMNYTGEHETLVKFRNDYWGCDTSEWDSWTPNAHQWAARKRTRRFEAKINASFPVTREESERLKNLASYKGRSVGDLIRFAINKTYKGWHSKEPKAIK
jgi:hypothetical protein